MAAWIAYGTLISPSTVRDLHPWQTLGGINISVLAQPRTCWHTKSTTALTKDHHAADTHQYLIRDHLLVTAGSNQITVTDINSGASSTIRFI